MPANLFDPTSAPTPVGRTRGLTVTTSVAIHTAALAIVVLGPLVAGVSMPSAMSRMNAFVAPNELPQVAPPPQPVATPARTPDPTINPDAAPINQPDAITPEVPRVDPNVTQAPGGILPIGGAGVPATIGVGPATGVTLGPPPPAPKQTGPLPVGGAIRPPERVNYASPIYPPIAQSARVEGTVILEAIIDEQGRVTNVRVLRSVPLLDDAAKQAVLQWRYSPTTLNGKPIAVIMNVTVRFTLR